MSGRCVSSNLCKRRGEHTVKLSSRIAPGGKPYAVYSINGALYPGMRWQLHNAVSC